MADQMNQAQYMEAIFDFTGNFSDPEFHHHAAANKGKGYEAKPNPDVATSHFETDDTEILQHMQKFLNGFNQDQEILFGDSSDGFRAMWNKFAPKDMQLGEKDKDIFRTIDGDPKENPKFIEACAVIAKINNAITSEDGEFNESKASAFLDKVSTITTTSYANIATSRPVYNPDPNAYRPTTTSFTNKQLRHDAESTLNLLNEVAPYYESVLAYHQPGTLEQIKLSAIPFGERDYSQHTGEEALQSLQGHLKTGDDMQKLVKAVNEQYISTEKAINSIEDSLDDTTEDLNSAIQRNPNAVRLIKERAQIEALLGKIPDEQKEALQQAQIDVTIQENADIYIPKYMDAYKDLTEKNVPGLSETFNASSLGFTDLSQQADALKAMQSINIKIANELDIPNPTGIWTPEMHANLADRTGIRDIDIRDKSWEEMNQYIFKNNNINEAQLASFQWMQAQIIPRHAEINTRILATHIGDSALNRQITDAAHAEKLAPILEIKAAIKSASPDQLFLIEGTATHDVGTDPIGVVSALSRVQISENSNNFDAWIAKEIARPNNILDAIEKSGTSSVAIDNDQIRALDTLARIKDIMLPSEVESLIPRLSSTHPDVSKINVNAVNAFLNKKSELPGNAVAITAAKAETNALTDAEITVGISNATSAIQEDRAKTGIEPSHANIAALLNNIKNADDLDFTAPDNIAKEVYFQDVKDAANAIHNQDLVANSTSLGAAPIQFGTAAANTPAQPETSPAAETETVIAAATPAEEAPAAEAPTITATPSPRPNFGPAAGIEDLIAAQMEILTGDHKVPQDVAEGIIADIKNVKNYSDIDTKPVDRALTDNGVTDITLVKFDLLHIELQKQEAEAMASRRTLAQNFNANNDQTTGLTASPAAAQLTPAA